MSGRRPCGNNANARTKFTALRRRGDGYAVMLSKEKLVAQLDCKDTTDGDRVILNKIAKVDGVVQTNIIAVVRPKKG